MNSQIGITIKVFLNVKCPKYCNIYVIENDTMHNNNNNNSHSILPSSQFHNFTCYISIKIRR